MKAHGLVALLAMLAAGSLLAAGSATADLQATKGCTAKAPPNARVSALSFYDDYIEDVQSAPDICGGNLITNDNASITVAMHIHDRSSFATGEVYSVVIDVDGNDATGGGPELGPLAGAEYVVDVQSETGSLRRWSGTVFEQTPAQQPILAFWIEDIGPGLVFSRLDIGNPQSFRFTLMTSNGVDSDLAPDTGGWNYSLTPFTLTAGTIQHGPARAGKPFVARMRVLRSDFEIELDEGRIACAATVGGHRLAGRGSFAQEHVACTWKVPKTMRGKTLRGSIAVAYGGASARRAFSARVR